MTSPLSVIAENRANSLQICALLCERAKPLPARFQSMFSNFSKSAYCILEEIINRAFGEPTIIGAKIGKLNSSQFYALYHVTIWSLAAAYTKTADLDVELMEEACSIFANPLDEEIPFTASVKKAFKPGDVTFLAMKLHQEYRRILGLPQAEDPGSLPFVALFVSAFRATQD